jgi:hypothetical protein
MGMMTNSPEKRPLLKRQRNDLHKAISDVGFDPREFALSEVPWIHNHAVMATRMAYLGTGYYFELVLVPNIDDWDWIAEPGFYEAHVEAERVENWIGVIENLKWWLKECLEPEVREPDLWYQDLETVATVESGDEFHNDPFSDGEVERIEGRIASVRLFVVESGVEGELLAEINRKLDYLGASAKRVGRFDWRNQAVGIAVTIAVSAAFNPQQAQNLLNLLALGAQRLMGS